ncbi:MAG TPA: hypothetical protein VF595_14220 [Tepidisphaeraceae bacterium]|jgi:hypothetical protein
MPSIEQIQQDIERLTADELLELSAWMEAREAVAWDKRFEADVAAGKFDAMADRALADLDAGRCTEL